MTYQTITQSSTTFEFCQEGEKINKKPPMAEVMKSQGRLQCWQIVTWAHMTQNIHDERFQKSLKQKVRFLIAQAFEVFNPGL